MTSSAVSLGTRVVLLWSWQRNPWARRTVRPSSPPPRDDGGDGGGGEKVSSGGGNGAGRRRLGWGRAGEALADGDETAAEAASDRRQPESRARRSVGGREERPVGHVG